MLALSPGRTGPPHTHNLSSCCQARRAQNRAACLAEVKLWCLDSECALRLGARELVSFGKELSREDMGSPPAARRRVLDFTLNPFFGLFSENLSLVANNLFYWVHSPFKQQPLCFNVHEKFQSSYLL